MSQSAVIGGGPHSNLLAEFRSGLSSAKPKAIAIASAYVSVYGVREVKRLLMSVPVGTCRLVAGTDDFVTHPEALRLAKKAGWDVRISKGHSGIFHPKLFVGGKSFDRAGQIVEPTFFYLGSANLTKGGLRTNTECAIPGRGDCYIVGLREAFADFWRSATLLDSHGLAAYARGFAERNRQRSLADLKALEVTDLDVDINISEGSLRSGRQPTAHQIALPPSLASLAWAGLQSFTGEYRFQVEFPRAAGLALRQLLGGMTNDEVDVECEDEEIRKMRFRYYPDNDMYRLNVPNNTPGVSWARKHRSGIAIVEPSLHETATIRFKILKPGPEMDDVISRSYALGTWGRTSTRLYGWL